MNLLVLLTGTWVTQRQVCHQQPTMVWVTAHKSCIAGASCFTCRQLSWLESFLSLANIIAYILLVRSLMNLVNFSRSLILLSFIYFLSCIQVLSRRECFSWEKTSSQHITWPWVPNKSSLWISLSTSCLHVMILGQKHVPSLFQLNFTAEPLGLVFSVQLE